jgi:hypothetical protein
MKGICSYEDFYEIIKTNNVEKVKEVIDKEPNIVNKAILNHPEFGSISITWYFFIAYVNEILYADHYFHRIDMLNLLMENCSSANLNMKLKCCNRYKTFFDFIIMYSNREEKYDIIVEIAQILISYDIQDTYKDNKLMYSATERMIRDVVRREGSEDEIIENISLPFKFNFGNYFYVQ